jgi:galactofuranosylgalactofuranosylrhamnosyl-N-acetylglucosaminyl-diphospho-decaprenol beta-1,5/1,6-galactofuranosyltransferase
VNLALGLPTTKSPGVVDIPFTTGRKTRIVQRVVFPIDDDPNVIPLYVEGDIVHRGGLTTFAQPCPHDAVQDRRSIKLSADARLSMGTYFNVFPASYWANSTKVQFARLVAVVNGTGTIEIFCSNDDGRNHFVTSHKFANANQLRVAIDISLRNFIPGGFYWFDLVTIRETAKKENRNQVPANAHATISEAWWEVDSHVPQGTVSVGVTTYNRPADVIDILKELALEPELLDRKSVV